MAPDDFIQTTCYLQVVPTYSAYRKDSNGEREVESLAVKSVTQKRPTKPIRGAVITKVKFRFPRAAFKALSPSIVVDIPMDMLASGEVLAEVEDANDA